ncbi:MAG: peptide chain release factor N(5)-glutamine methyltransferase [Candidatus Omnitrophota bacterium]
MKESELVMTHLLGCDKLSLYLNKDGGIAPGMGARLSSVLKRRISGEPVQYILGESGFMGMNFKVDGRVLIPRPETEILVEAGIRELKEYGKARPRILDLGTGSGCIAVSVARLFPSCDAYASDISSGALSLAEENAAMNGVKVKFLQGDLFAALGGKEEKFDMIISNPPYISSPEIDFLQREISFEPRIALEGGPDGMDFYRRIIGGAGSFLNDKGIIALEAGFGQAHAVKDILLENKFTDLSLIRDYNNIERVVMARKGFIDHG